MASSRDDYTMPSSNAKAKLLDDLPSGNPGRNNMIQLEGDGQHDEDLSRSPTQMTRTVYKVCRSPVAALNEVQGSGRIAHFRCGLCRH